MASGDTLFSFTPQHNMPPSSGYMTLNLRNAHLVLEATASSTDTAIFVGIMPNNYAGGGITVTVTWCAKTAVAGAMGFDVTFERNNNGADITGDHWATAQDIADTTVPGSAGTLKQTSISITAGAAGTASLAAGDAYRLRLRRHSTDTAAGSAQIFGVGVKET